MSEPKAKTRSSLAVNYGSTGGSVKSNELGMRAMQERAYAMRGEQYLLIKSPPASGKSRALMFIALDKLNKQGIKQAIIAVPEKSIGSSFADEPLTKFGFFLRLVGGAPLEPLQRAGGRRQQGEVGAILPGKRR